MGIEEILNLHTHWIIDTAPIIYYNDKRLKSFSELTVIVLDDFLEQTPVA